MEDYNVNLKYSGTEWKLPVLLLADDAILLAKPQELDVMVEGSDDVCNRKMLKLSKGTCFWKMGNYSVILVWMEKN